MNIDNMQRLLAFYEAGAPHFDLVMNRPLVATTFHNELIPQLCGSAGCIAGSAFAMALADLPEREAAKIATHNIYSKDLHLNGRDAVSYTWAKVQPMALDFLGLEYPDNGDGEDIGMHPLFDQVLAPQDCTARQAAQAIRNVMDGKEPWHGVA